MTRVTFGMYRKGVREPATTMTSAAAANAGFTLVTPMRIAQSAIVRHHRESPAAARARLHQSFRNSDYWGPNGTPQARGWARVIRELYDVYDGLTQGDPRTAFAYGVERDIALGVDALGVRADVVLFDPAGYVPRVVLWDKNDLSRARAIEYGAPVWRAMEDELGQGRVAAVEVWALRGPTQITVTPAQAGAAMGQVARTVHRLVQ
jgi:hypothetical protein